jgi:hypothetical protein
MIGDKSHDENLYDENFMVNNKTHDAFAFAFGTPFLARRFMIRFIACCNLYS